MAELTFRSPGVGTSEIDLSAPSGVAPSGTPAAVIGTAQRGPAFVPVTVATFQDFVATFGPTDGQKFGPLAMREWLRNAGSGVYTRLLGAGNGERRNVGGNNPGNVTNAGYVVGQRLPLASNGLLGDNPYAETGGVGEGRLYFLGAFMSESNGSTYLSTAGVQASANAVPVIRAALMFPSGVFPSLSANGVASNEPGTTTINGFNTGTVDYSNRNSFILLLNGHKNTAENPNVITASFDPTAPNYFSNLLNTDPFAIETAGHYLYTRYDIRDAIATVNGTGLTVAAESAFVLSGSLARNVGSANVPNYDNFEDRYRTAFSPWFISQQFGGRARNLFKVHALDDGAYPNARFKLSIENIATSRDAKSPYGTFSLLVRRFNDTDFDPAVLERFDQLSLDPDSDRYIARVIGDRHAYFDWDKRVASQRLVVDGNYANQSSLIRVEMAAEIDDKSIDATALPVGFRGPHHLVTSGSALLGTAGTGEAAIINSLNSTVQPPVPFRDTVALGTGLKKRASNAFYWGVQFEVKDSPTEPNRSTTHDESMTGFTTYFPNFHTSWLNPWAGDNAGAALAGGGVVDSDLFNNNLFTLERVAVRTGSDGIADAAQWLSASYVRNGSSAGISAPVRFLDVGTDLGSGANRPFIKFSTVVQGGFDGVNSFDRNKSQFLDLAVKREVADTAQGGTSGPTVSAYRKALTVLGSRSNADVQLLAIPGIRQAAVTDFAIQEVEDRFDAMYIMDVEPYDTVNAAITGSGQEVSVTYTAAAFTSRNLDSSFAAAYFPDVTMEDTTTRTNLVVPPSVAVLGAFALNDAVAFPWFAPAGFTRGALTTTLETTVKFNRANLDVLYEADINPIATFPGQPPVVFGQKTLQQAQSALDRVNVRRLLIDLRRKVRAVANTFVFEPNRASTLARFQSQVQPILQTVQAQQGVERFKVVIDTTTTTQADVENNTVRGKIFLQPTRSLEFVSLDFVVTNTGAVV